MTFWVDKHPLWRRQTLVAWVKRVIVSSSFVRELCRWTMLTQADSCDSQLRICLIIYERSLFSTFTSFAVSTIKIKEGRGLKSILLDWSRSPVVTVAIVDRLRGALSRQTIRIDREEGLGRLFYRRVVHFTTRVEVYHRHCICIFVTLYVMGPTHRLSRNCLSYLLWSNESQWLAGYSNSAVEGISNYFRWIQW